MFFIFIVFPILAEIINLIGYGVSIGINKNKGEQEVTPPKYEKVSKNIDRMSFYENPLAVNLKIGGSWLQIADNSSSIPTSEIIFNKNGSKYGGLVSLKKPDGSLLLSSMPMKDLVIDNQRVKFYIKVGKSKFNYNLAVDKLVLAGTVYRTNSMGERKLLSIITFKRDPKQYL